VRFSSFFCRGGGGRLTATTIICISSSSSSSQGQEDTSTQALTSKSTNGLGPGLLQEKRKGERREKGERGICAKVRKT